VLQPSNKNQVRRSLISLLIYAALFYFIFGAHPIYIAAVLLAVLVHEFGHFFAMRYYNYSDVKMFVLPLLGAYVSGKKAQISQTQMTVVILAGPLPGLLIGAGLLAWDFNTPNERVNMLGNIFFFLNLFNMLPFIPLDGGRLLETLFIGERHIIRLVFTIISIICLLIISLAFQQIILLLVPLSMIFGLIMEVKNQKVRNILKQEHINYTIDYPNLSDKSYWSIRDCILLAFPGRYKGVDAGVYQYSIAEGALLQHVMSVLQTPFILDLKIFGKIFITLLYIGVIVGSIAWLVIQVKARMA